MNPDSTTEKPSGNKGRFQPGVSGNPQGRPKCETVALRKSLIEGGDEVVIAILEAAKAGDMTAAKIVLDRILPPLKATAQAVHVSLPDGADPLAIARAVMLSAASGNLPPDVAAQLVTAAAQLARVEEIEDLRDRLTALEKATRPPTIQSKKKP